MSDLGDASNLALWWAVIGSGIYHGINPGMGWPLAVSAALMERRRAAMARALVALALGHLLAMSAILLPFSMIDALLDWERPIRIVASALVVSAGVYLLVNRRHPRFLARVPPHRLALWSFLVATAHGAGLMLLPIYLGLQAGGGTGGMGGMSGEDMGGHDMAGEDMGGHDMGGHEMAGHDAAGQLIGEQAAGALLVAGVHTLAMVASGAVLAVAVYAWFGLRGVTRSWFNLDLVWAASLVLVGLVSGAAALLS